MMHKWENKISNAKFNFNSSLMKSVVLFPLN